MAELKRQIGTPTHFRFDPPTAAKLDHIIMEIYMNMDSPLDFDYVERDTIHGVYLF